MKAYYDRSRGRPKKKPIGFSETMRKVNPPLGRKVLKDYVVIYKPDEPSSYKRPPNYGYILEHRYVIEQYLGRQLKPTERVHHLDGDKINNKLSNLLLCPDASMHHRIHHRMENIVFDMIKTGEVTYDRKSETFVRSGRQY